MYVHLNFSLFVKVSYLCELQQNLHGFKPYSKFLVFQPALMASGQSYLLLLIQVSGLTMGITYRAKRLYSRSWLGSLDKLMRKYSYFDYNIESAAICISKSNMKLFENKIFRFQDNLL